MAATTVYETVDIVLQNNDEVTIRPLDLKRLRRVMKVIEEMNSDTAKEGVGENDGDNLSFLIAATKICLEKQLPDLVKDEEAFDEALDLPTIWKVLEVGAGITMGNPNLQGGAALPGLISN